MDYEEIRDLATPESSVGQELTATFDYTQLESDTAAFLQEQATEIKASWRRTQQELIAIGKRLLAAKDRLPHGLFLPWITSEFGMSNSTSWRLMQLAQGKSFTVKDLAPPIEAPVTSRPIPDYGFIGHHSGGQWHIYKPIDGTLLALDPSYADLCKGLWDRYEQMWTDTNFVTDAMREHDPIAEVLRKALDDRIASGVPTKDHQGWLYLDLVQRDGCHYRERPFEEEEVSI